MEHKTYTCDVCGKKIDVIPEVWEWLSTKKPIRIAVRFSHKLDSSYSKETEAHLCWPCIREAVDKLYCRVNKHTEYWEKQGT